MSEKDRVSDMTLQRSERSHCDGDWYSRPVFSAGVKTMN